MSRGSVQAEIEKQRFKSLLQQNLLKSLQTQLKSQQSQQHHEKFTQGKFLITKLNCFCAKVLKITIKLDSRLIFGG